MSKQYIMKGLDAEFWQRVKVKAAQQVPNQSVKDVIVKLLTDWLSAPSGEPPTK